MITRPHAFMVLGPPVQQGDMTCYGTGKGGRGHRLVHSNQEDLDPWRKRVAAAARKWVVNAPDGGETADEHQPIDVAVTWSLERPKGHWGTGRNADTLKPSAPAYPATGLDVDKLQRAVFDALQQSGVIRNDAQIIDPLPRKRYALTRDQTIAQGPLQDDVLPCPGVVIRIYPKE